MLAVHVEIARLIDDAFPRWVECHLTDAYGAAHRFVEKVPIVSTEDLDRRSDYPRPGSIACELVAHLVGERGEALLVIDTESPHGVASTAQQHRFTVTPAQLIRS